MTSGRIDRLALAAVAGRVRAEIGSVDRVVGILGDALTTHQESEPEIVVIHGVAGLIHDFYSGVERVLRAVIGATDASQPAGDSWHRELLRSAALDLAGVRPAILSTAAADELGDYLAFRHVFRNLYAFNLRWDRVRQLAEGVPVLWARVRAELLVAAAFIDTLATDS